MPRALMERKGVWSPQLHLGRLTHGSPRRALKPRPVSLPRVTGTLIPIPPPQRVPCLSVPTPAFHAGRDNNIKTSMQARLTPRKSARAYFCKPRARAASVQWGKAVMSNTGMDGEGSNCGQLMTDRVSEWKTLLKAMNSIPNPRLYSQWENLRPREGWVLYQDAQQIKW